MKAREKACTVLAVQAFLKPDDEMAKLLSGFGSLLGDLPAQQTSAHRQFGFVGLEQEGVKAAAMFDRTQGMRRNTQAEALAESVGDQRDLAKVRQEPAAGLVVGVAYVVAGLNALAGQFAHTRHGYTFVLLQSDGTSGQCPARRSNWS